MPAKLALALAAAMLSTALPAGGGAPLEPLPKELAAKEAGEGPRGAQVTIDNGTVGDGAVSVVVEDAGDTQTLSVDPAGGTGPTDVVWNYFHSVQVGGGAAERLSATASISAHPAGPRAVASSGSFAGANGTVSWSALSSLTEGSPIYTTELRFSSAAPLGPIRVICYLDEDVLGFADDVLVELGSPGTAGFQLLTIDDATPVGVSQAALYTASWEGWAADAYPELRDAIAAGTATFSEGGVVDTASLPPLADPRFPGRPAYGPEDVSTAVAFVLPPAATSATVLCSLGGEPDVDLVTHVALGDSYSSGEGAGQYGATDVAGRNLCHRSARAWTADEPGGSADSAALPEAELRHSAACSGAVLAHLTGAREFPPDGTGDEAEPAQLNDPVLPQADVVTLTLGGNDALFAKVLTECAWTGLFGTNCDDPEFVPDDETEPLRDQVDAAIDDLAAGRLQAAYDAVEAVAPGAAVYVVGYPRLFGDPAEGCLGNFFQESERTWINELADRLAGTIECAAAAAGLPYVDVRNAFAGHHVCAGGQRWLHGVGGVSHPNERFHPNLAGQIGYAFALRDRVANPQPVVPCPAPQLGPPRATPPPEQGELHVEAEVAGCGLLFHTFVPGQTVRVAGQGFAPASTAALRLRAGDGAFNQALGNLVADGAGRIDATVQLPPGAPAAGEALLKATGLRPGGATYTLYAPLTLAPSATADGDLDGVPDACDRCPAAADPGQADADGDGRGDACDLCPGDPEDDADGDGLCANADPCPADPGNDADADGVCAPVDRCPTWPNETPEAAFACRFADTFESGDLSAWSAAVP